MKLSLYLDFMEHRLEKREFYRKAAEKSRELLEEARKEGWVFADSEQQNIFDVLIGQERFSNPICREK